MLKHLIFFLIGCFSLEASILTTLYTQSPSIQYEKTCSSFLQHVATLSKDEEMKEFISAFKENPYQERQGKDKELRPLFVHTQGAIEQVLACYFHKKKITHLVGIIHTPLPATPLCMQNTLNPRLIDAQLELDTKRVNTVVSRAQILRTYLDLEGTLIVAYPQKKLSQRTPEQQTIYRECVAKHPHHLVDLPLSCDELPPNLSGATYFFCTAEGDWMMFSVQAAQAIAPNDQRIWAMWIGSLSHPSIYQRASAILHFLEHHQNLDLMSKCFR